MTTYWDEKILDVWNEIQIRQQLEEMNQQKPQLTWEECLEAAELGSMEYDGCTLEFAERMFFDERVRLILPCSLQLIPKGLMSQSSAAQPHEQLACQDEEGTILLGINHMAHPLSMNEAESFLQAMTAQIKKKTPGLQIVKNDLWEHEGLRVAICEYVVPMADGAYYQIMFATSVMGRAFFGSMVFPAREVWLWQPLANALIRTLRVNEGA